MARGYVYEITGKPELYSIGVMCEEDLRHECDYVSRSSISESCIAETLSQYGFEITDAGDDGHDTAAFLTVTEEAKENYFRGRFGKLKHEIGRMTLDDFVKMVDNIQELINSQTGDAVYYDSSFYTLDEFIRSAEPGTYHIGNVFLMH